MTFNENIRNVKNIVCAWSDYSQLREVTIIRDVLVR